MKAQLWVVWQRAPSVVSRALTWCKEELSALGKENDGSSPVKLIKPNAMIPLSKLPFQWKF